MISLQRSMHSSQMYTPGPAMSFLTCFWDFPQNEHFNRSESPILAMPVAPLDARGRVLAPGLGRRYYDAPAAAAASSGRILRVVMTSSTTPYSTASGAVR